MDTNSQNTTPTEPTPPLSASETTPLSAPMAAPQPTVPSTPEPTLESLPPLPPVETKKTDKGSKIFIIILIVLLLVAVGYSAYAFMQNKSQADSITSKDQQIKSLNAQIATLKTNNATTLTPRSTGTALVLNSYGVEVPYDSTTDTYTVVDQTTGPFAGGYVVYSKKVTDACGPDVNVGMIKQFSPTDATPTPSNVVTVGNSKYALGVGGYGDCSSDSGQAALGSASKAFADAFANLKTTN